MSDARFETSELDAHRVQDLTSFQRDLLFVVAGCGAPSGQEVKGELEESTEDTILPGQLYPNLDELAEAGLVTKGNRDGRTNNYTLTERGRRVLTALVRWQCSHVERAHH